MKKFLYIFGAILGLFIAAAIIAPLAFNPNDYKEQLAKAIEDKSGYKLVISGDIKLSVLPNAKASVEGVTISAGDKAAFVEVKELRAYMKIRPLLSGKVEIDEIKLVEPKIKLVQLGKSNNWTANKPKVVEEKTKAKRELKVSDFSIVDGDVDFNNNGNEIKVSKINLNAAFINNDLELKKFSANIFGGSVDASGNVKLGDVVQTSIKFHGKGLDLHQIAEGLMRNKRIEKGLADLSGDLSAFGITPDKIAASLNGSGKISATQVAIRGFDMGAFAANVQQIKSPTDLLPLLNSFKGEGQSTKINSITGDFHIKNGVIELPGMKLNADYAQGDYSGVIDLPRSYMNTIAKFNLVSIDKKTSPKVGLKINGPISSPSLNPDLSDLTRWAISKYGSKLLDKVPEKYKGFLSGF